MKKTILLLFTFHLSLFTSSSIAQPGGGRFHEDHLTQKQERLQTMIVMRLTNEVGLNQDQALKVSEIMRKYQMQRRMLHQKMRGLNQQLRMVAYSNDPKQATQVVSDLQKTKDEIDRLDDAMFNEIRPMLNPQQQAKFLLVMQDVRREMMQFRRGGGKGMGGGPGFGHPPSPNPSSP